MSRPLEYELLGQKVIRRVPENAIELENLYESLNLLYIKGYKPKNIIRELEKLLTALSNLETREDLCEILSDMAEKLEN